MAVDLHKKICAYLRENGKSDMGGYHLDWVNGRTSIGRWDYQDVPQPTNDALAAVAQQYLDYETDTVYTHDIYTGTIVTDNAPSGANWLIGQLNVERQPNISAPTTPQSIKIIRGYWKITINGFSDDNIILQITVGDDVHPVNQKRYMSGSFEMTRTLHVNSDKEIRLRVHRYIQNGNNTGGRLNITYTVLLEKV
jgi:hypothetical protein